MLLSLLPTTALAASYADISVNGILLRDAAYLADNSSTSATTGANNEPSSYVAWYKNGVLTLKGYNGKGIETQGVAAGELTVKLIGSNSINNGALQSDQGGDITVTSDSSGTLSISKTTIGSNPAIGIETGLSGSYTTGNVTIKGNAKVTINMTHNGTSTYEKAYGIFAKENITISENASVDITCATPNNTTGGGNCNGLYAKENVTIDTNGTIKIDVTNAGKDKDNGYSYGVYYMGTATLTKVGNMEVQWKKEGNSTTYTGGAITRGVTFSDTDHAINVDTTNCYASYRYGTSYYTVTAGNGKLTGPGVKCPNGSGKFLAGDKVSITPNVKTGKSGEVIPFQKWTSDDVTFDKLATTASNSFTVPAGNVMVIAEHNPFVETPTFTPPGTTGTKGTLTFKTVVKADASYECFKLVKDGDQNDESKYIDLIPDNFPSTSPYVYELAASSSSSASSHIVPGDYYVAEKLDGWWYLSEKFTVDYTAATTPTATMDAVTIGGVKDSPISKKEVKITLTNDKFKAIVATTDVEGWFTNLPAGLEAKITTAVNENDTTATIEISGTPSETSSAPLTIKIPAANLASNTDLTVTSNENAVFTITAPTYSVNIVAGANMSISGTASQSGLTGAMTEVVYTADSGYYFPTDYSVASVNGVDVTRIDFTKIKVSGTPTGTVNITLADATAKTKETQPSATFTATGPDSGTLSNLVNGGEYAVTGAAVANFTASSTTHDLNDVSAGTLSIVKNGNGTTTTDSTAQTITVNKATAPAGVTPVGCTTDSNNDGKLENVTAAMEYQKSGDSAWTPCGGTEVANLTNGTYYVRVKVNGTTLASDSQSVTINANGTTPAAQPDASFTATGRDAGTLLISGTYTATMKYSVDGGYVWNDVTSASMDITGVTAANGIQVKDVGNGTTISASSVKSITVTEGTKPTGLTVTQPNTIGGKGKIETDTSHEYNTDGGTTFTPCTGALDNLTAGDYHVRVKANGTMLASETENYTITAFTGTPETQPGATFTATGPDSGTLRNLVSGGKYAVTGAAAATFTASGTTHDLTGVVAGTLSIVKKGDGITMTDSTAQTITVIKAATPSTVTAVGCTTGSNNDGKLKNVTADMEYQKSGDPTWTPGTGSDIINLSDGTYLVRVKATGTTLASDNQSVVVAVYTGGGTSGGSSSGGFSGGGYVPTTQKPDIKAGEGGSIALSKDGTTATITPNAGMMIDKVMLNGKDMGALTIVKGIKTGDKLEVSFKQAAEEKAKMDKAVAEQVAKAGLTARSARTAKKNVKLVVKSDLEGITDAGYTVEYKFYRSTKKSAGYKAMKTGKSGIYINTYGKKGTLYYYKVKVMVYDKDGNLTAQTTLKQCKYASRLWTK